MTENNPIRVGGCSLCLYEDIEKYEQDYITKRSTVAEIVDELKADNVECNRYKFYNHMRSHLKPEVAMIFSKNAELLSNEMVDKVGEIVIMLDQVKGKIEALDNSINADAQPAMIKAYTGLISEARRLVEELASLQEKFKGSAHIHINTLNVEYSDMKEQILQDVCQNCKVKLSKTLAPLAFKADTLG